LLRDINDPTTSTLALQIRQKVEGLSGFVARLEEVKTYLHNVLSGRMPTNNQILYNLQNIFNLLPNLNVDDLVRSILVKTNDMHLVIYISTLVRSVIALHNLLNNKIQYRDIDDALDRKAGINTTSAEEKDATKTASASTPSKPAGENSS
jgi:26S proteasome regulatory subunit N8